MFMGQAEALKPLSYMHKLCCELSRDQHIEKYPSELVVAAHEYANVILKPMRALCLFNTNSQHIPYTIVLLEEEKSQLCAYPLNLEEDNNNAHTNSLIFILLTYSFENSSSHLFVVCDAM